MSSRWSFALRVALICLLLISCSGRKNAEDRYYYDAQFRLTEYRNAEGQRFQVRYGSGGRPSEVQGPQGKLRFAYDAQGNCIWRRAPGLTEQLFYDAFDQLAALASLRGRRLWITTLEHDWRGQPVRVEILDADHMKENSETRALVEDLERGGAPPASNWGSRERQTLQALDEMRNRPPDERRSWTVYSADYSYDLMGRITAIQSAWGVIRYLYRSETGEAIRTLPNGVRSVFRFLPGGQLASLRHEKDGAPLYEYDYAHAADGPVSRWTERTAGGRLERHLAADAERSPVGEIALADFDSGGVPKQFNLYGDGLLASWTASGDVRFYLEDGFGRVRHAVDRSGLISPFTPARRRGAPLGGGAFVSTVSHDVFVGGIEVTPDALAEIGSTSDVDTISTSALGRTWFPAWVEEAVDPFRAIFNYFGAPGGKAEALNELRAAFDRDPQDPLTILAHSNGAITIYQMKEALAQDIQDGRLKVHEIVIAGAGVAASLQAFFASRGIDIPVREDNPANRMQDVVRLITTPNAELGQDFSCPFLSPGVRGAMAKVAGAEVALWGAVFGSKGRDEFVGLAHHTIPENYSDLLPAVARNDAAGRFDFRADPFVAVRKELGGVKLSAPGGVDPDFGELAGVVYDSAKQSLVVLGRHKEGRIHASMADFSVALRLARESREAEFTLDPADPKDPRGPWMRAVYIPSDILSGTAFGRTLFDTDWLLKQYSFNTEVREDGTQTERHVGVPGFKSLRDLSFEIGDSTRKEDRWSRLWIEVEQRKIPAQADAGIMLIENPRMVIKACRTVPDPSSPQGIRDICDVKDAVNTAFITMFTKLYDRIAEESPGFARLKELAKLMVVAKWAVQQGVAVGDGQIRAASRSVPTVERVSALKGQWQRTTEQPSSKGGGSGIRTILTSTVELFGGVNLTVDAQARSASPEVRSLRDDVVSKIDSPGASPVFSVPYRGETLSGVVAPLNGNTSAPWDNFAAGSDGQVYETADINGSPRVRRRIAPDGGIEEYEYGAASVVTKVISRGLDGSVTVGERASGRSVWTTTTARGNTFRNTYDAQGRLIETAIDGGTAATYTFDAARSRITAHYKHGEETVSFDSAGRVREYRVLAAGDANEQAISVEYSAQNRITKISGPGNQQFQIGYDKQGTMPVTWSGAAGQTRFSYDDQRRLTSETFADGTSVSYTWAGSSLEKVEWSRPGATAEERYGPNGVVSSQSSDGRTATYEYTRQGLPSVWRDAGGETRFEYDADGDLSRLRLPDGVTLRVERTREGEVDSLDRIRRDREPAIPFPESHPPAPAPTDI